MPATAPPKLTLHAVDLEVVAGAFRRKPIAQLIEALPRGRVAAVCAGLELDLSRPAADAVHGRRNLFDAIVEDHARATLWDAPRDAFDDALRLLGLDGLDEGAPAYPTDVLDDDGEGTLKVWCDDRARVTAAEAKLKAAHAAVAGTLLASDPALVTDILDALAPILTAALRPGVFLVLAAS